MSVCHTCYLVSVVGEKFWDGEGEISVLKLAKGHDCLSLSMVFSAVSFQGITLVEMQRLESSFLFFVFFFCLLKEDIFPFFLFVFLLSC